MKRTIKVLLVCLIVSAIAIILICGQEYRKTNKIANSLKGELLFAYGKDGLYILTLPTEKLDNIAESENYSIVFPSYPSWSPGGKEIVLSQYKENIGLLTIIRSANKTIKELNDIKLDCDYPSWSPNGDYIAFLGRPIKSEYYNLYILSINDMRYHMLSSILAGPYRPMWSPDSSQIVFSSSDRRILIINVRGRDVEAIIPVGVSPAWSPDRNYVVYRARYSVYLHNFRNNTEKELISNLGFSDIRDFAWSPDSKFIAFKRLSESRSPIEILSLDGRTKIKLKEFGNLRGLSWRY